MALVFGIIDRGYALSEYYPASVLVHYIAPTQPFNSATNAIPIMATQYEIGIE